MARAMAAHTRTARACIRAVTRYCETCLRNLSFAELVDPFGEDIVAGRLDVNELDAHAYARLDDAHYGKALCHLPFAGESDSRARFQRQRLAGANEATAKRNIGG